MKHSMVDSKKGIKKVMGNKREDDSKTKKVQFFHSAIFPLEIFNDDFFEVAIKETTRGFLEEN